MLTNEGLKYIKDVSLLAGTQITVWYMGIFSNDYTPTGTETYASPGCTESTDYSETVRQTWQGAEITNLIASNTANKATFTMGGTDTEIYGYFIVSLNTKGDTAGGGTLLCITPFTDGVESGFGAGDQLKVTTPYNFADM